MQFVTNSLKAIADFETCLLRLHEASAKQGRQAGVEILRFPKIPRSFSLVTL
jgi:hypothetical protein